MISSCDMKHILVNNTTSSLYKGNICSINVEKGLNEIEDVSNQILPKTDLNDMAYIIFTSGSTGNPKGVSIRHKNIINTLLWRRRYYNFDSDEVVLQIPSFSFDSSVLCFPKLMNIFLHIVFNCWYEKQ